MPDINSIRSAFDRKAKEVMDLNDMVVLPRSPVQFNATVIDIVQKLKFSPESTLCDVGCGNSNLLRFIRPYVTRAVGVDLSIEQLKVGISLKHGSEFAVGEGRNLPFKSFYFDRVLCYSVIHHFPDKQYAFQAIESLCRTCKPGGLVLIGDIPDKRLRRKAAPLGWELIYRFNVLRGKHPGPSIFNPLAWQFYDKDELLKSVQKLNYHAEIFPQPKDLIAAEYRYDLLIRV